MKREVTRKYLKALYSNNAICFPDGAGQCLFPASDADYYTSGIYGWNFDAWEVNGCLINSGYRNTFGIEAGYEIIKKYDDKARELREKYFPCGDYNEYKERLKELQKEFINAVLVLNN